MIICAFIVDPELYIIDEPFLGLDPLGIQSMLDPLSKIMNRSQYLSAVARIWVLISTVRPSFFFSTENKRVLKIKLLMIFISMLRKVVKRHE
jgi:energy-coupling factor transporter ATP-binding protein EcfA2